MQIFFNMKFRPLLISCFLITIFCAQLEAQPGFRGSAIVGLNLAQLDGDDLVGFNKTGVTSGLKVAFDLKSKLEGNVEILYSQRGSSESLFRQDTSAMKTITTLLLSIN